MLTRKQQELLLFIHRRLQDGGVSPSFDEMKEALGLKSKSGIHRLIGGLEERGFIRRLPHRARALEVVRLPDGVDAAADAPVRFQSRTFAPKPARDKPAVHLPEASNDVGMELPLYGKIAAGTPIEALRDPNEMIAVPANFMGAGEHYALTVDGDSMIDAGILDGDTIVIRRAEQADSGDIVVALVDGEEVTLKRLRRKGNTIALEPANRKYETRIFGADRVRIQGRLVGLIRHYT
ncbi:MAG: transcriptional repressor LexA [Azospirillaceae bacterium]